MSRPFRTSATQPESLLAVSLATADRRALVRLCAAMSWNPVFACRPAPALRKAKFEAVRVVLCERNPPGGDWKILFDQVRGLPRPPRFIVTSRLADEGLWVEVLNRGGYDVLATPFRAEEVLRVIAHAMADAPARRFGDAP